MTSVTTILFEKTFRQTSHSFTQIFLYKSKIKDNNVKSIPDKTLSNSPVMFVTLKRFAVLLRKHPIDLPAPV